MVHQYTPPSIDLSVHTSFLTHFRQVLTELVNLLAASSDRITIYNLLSRLLHDFGAGLHSTQEVKLLDECTRVVADDIGSISSTATFPSLFVNPLGVVK